ncbi:MAG: hypothetical protein LBU87_02080 [Lactobacillales bacterium]|jgi:uncharacterized membrane protein YgaE (UPF0421/DUF939 family)|nr:hypothetical protein [Lactobacillales bacterium]
MYGILLLTTITFISLCLVTVFVIFYRLGAKLFGKKFIGIIIGLLASIAVFLILFGDDIYKYYEFQYICKTETLDQVYDQEAYKKYFKNSKARKTIELKGIEQEKFMRENNIEEYDTKDTAFYDKDNNYLYFSVEHNNERYLETKIINLNNKRIIKHYKNYYGHGGWFTVLISGSAKSDSLGSCRSKKLGIFRK